jgi:hypothetical protein
MFSTACSSTQLVTSAASIFLLGFALVACEPSIPECGAITLARPPPEYLTVEYSSGQDTTEPSARVETSSNFQTLRPRLQTAALRPPDACLDDQSATEPSLRSTCAPWVKELELVLADGGLQVIGWAGLLKYERREHVTTDAAAANLHADVVFVFDKLELFDLTGAAGLARRFQYFRSDPFGHELGEVIVDAETRGTVERFITLTLDEAPDPTGTTAIASVVDAHADVTSTGERIWRYQRAAMAPLQRGMSLKFLFGRNDGPWTSIAPRPASDEDVLGTPPMVGSDMLRAARTFHWLQGPNRGQDADSVRFELLHTGAIDFDRRSRDRGIHIRRAKSRRRGRRRCSFLRRRRRDAR